MKFIFECSTRYLTSERSERVHEISRLNPRRSISYLQAPIYYSIYYINVAQFFQKVNIPKVISGHMCLIRYQNTCVLIRHFSVAKIPITHCSLYNKGSYFQLFGGPPSNLNGRRGILTEWNGFQMNFNMSDNW